MIKLLKDIVTGILVLCALLVTAALVRREFFPPPVPGSEPRDVEGWEQLTEAGQWLGSRGAPVTVVEFADFQCPFCSIAADNLRELRVRYGDQVAVVYRHYPISAIHPYAWDAAVAAECASVQGKFEEFHDILYRDQQSIGAKSWTDYAVAVGVPSSSAFNECLATEEPRERVEKDYRAARWSRLDSTPSVIINGVLLPGTPSLATLEAHVEAALAERPTGK